MPQAILALRATQQTALTPRLQQSVRLLQLSSTDFAQELEQALATNPFLEVLPTVDASFGQASEVAWDGAPRGADPASNFIESVVADASLAVENGVALLDQRSSSVEQLDSIAMPAHEHEDGADFHDGGYAQTDRGAPSDRSSHDDIDVGAWAEAQTTLRMHLHAGLAGSRLDQREREIAELVIEAVDDDGYLRQDLAEVAAHFDFEPPVGADELARALDRVQQIGPAGIAARGVAECLALQIAALASATPCRLKAGLDAACIRVALAMVDLHLERVAARDWAGIRRLLDCPLPLVMQAAELIRSLDPRPGSAFGSDVAQAVVPDVIVRRMRNGWHTDINPAVVPRLALNRVYAALFHEARGGDRQPLGQQLQEARWLLRNAAQRFVTIRRVARAIVAEQSAFFDYGDIAIKPLLLRQVADQLELHESTISRAIGNKFMATPRGVFAFKHFFSRRLDTVSGGSCSAASIRAAMRELLDREDHHDPMSDVVLAKRLTDQGLCVARRTVTKYRSLMRIPPVEMRRRA